METNYISKDMACYNIIGRIYFSHLNSVDEEGRTPLMLAVKKQNLYIVKHLVAKGANLTCCDKKGNNVFHLAANSNKDIVMVSLASYKLSYSAVVNKSLFNPFVTEWNAGVYIIKNVFKRA